MEMDLRKLSDDELIDIYCDLGAMGKDMDCSEEEWNAISAEVARRFDVQ